MEALQVCWVLGAGCIFINTLEWLLFIWDRFVSRNCEISA